MSTASCNHGVCGTDYYIRVGHQLTKIGCFSRGDKFYIYQSDLTQPQPNYHAHA